jgi:hypothetical protein
MPRAAFLYTLSYPDGLPPNSEWLGQSDEVFRRSVSILLGGLPTGWSEETGLKAVTAHHCLRPSGHCHRFVRRVRPIVALAYTGRRRAGQPGRGTTEAAGVTRPEFVARVTP